MLDSMNMYSVASMEMYTFNELLQSDAKFIV